MFDNISSPAHRWPDGLTQEPFASRAFADPAQQPLDDDHMCGHYDEFEEVRLRQLLR